MPKSDEARTRLGSNLASEMAIWYTVNQLWDALRLFLADVDKHCGTACSLKDRVLDATSSLAVHDGDYEKAMIVITSHCFPSYGGDRQRLIDTWHAAPLAIIHASVDSNPPAGPRRNSAVGTRVGPGSRRRPRASGACCAMTQDHTPPPCPLKANALA